MNAAVVGLTVFRVTQLSNKKKTKKDSLQASAKAKPRPIKHQQQKRRESRYSNTDQSARCFFFVSISLTAKKEICGFDKSVIGRSKAAKSSQLESVGLGSI